MARTNKYVMRLDELFGPQRLDELVNAPDLEVYHWTNAANLRRMFKQNVVRGTTTHEIDGRSINGVSLSRNPFFDIQQTYAIAGYKPWRIGFSLQKLRYDHKVMPIRDEQYRELARGRRKKQNVTLGFLGPSMGTKYISSDESEEFCVGDIYPMFHYMTSIAVEADNIDPQMHPRDMDDDEDYDPISKSDQHLLFDFYAGTLFGMAKYKEVWGKRRNSAIRLNVPLLVIDRDTHTVQPFAEVWGKHIGVPEQPEDLDDIESIDMWSDQRRDRANFFNQQTRKAEGPTS